MAASEGVVIGIETQLDAKGDVKLLKEINSSGIKIYFKFQNALENGRDFPSVRNVVFVPWKAGDNTARIQRAIDYVASLTPDASGFR